MGYSYPELRSVRTYRDLMVMEENPLYRYEIPKYWLELEILGISGMLEAYGGIEDSEPYFDPLLMPVPKKAPVMESVVSRSIPLFMRL